MADIGSLIVKIGADASGLQKAFSDLGGSANQFEAGLKRLGKFGAEAFLATSLAAVAMTVAAGKQAEELEHLSLMTGINTDKLQEYDVLLNRAGLDSNDLATVMRTLSKNLEDAQQGTGNAADRFRQLGIDIRKVTSTDDLIRKVADSLSKFANGTAKAAIEADLLGRGGLRLALAMEGGSKSMDEAAQASTRLGAALSTGQLAELANMDNQIDDMTLAWKRFGQQIGSFVAPVIDFAAHALANLLNMASQGLKSLNALGGIGLTPDDRRQPPKLIDTAKISAQQQAFYDAQLHAMESSFNDADRLAKAEQANYMAQLQEKNAFGILTTREFAAIQHEAVMNMGKFEQENATRMLANYRLYIAEKRTAFTTDQKGQADRLKFIEESTAKEASLINLVRVAQINADTERIQSGLRVKTFWQQQLQDIVASNVFSVGQIITSWTGGIANAIVTGQDFIKSSIQATEIALIQGALQFGVQRAAIWALQASVELGILSATEATKLGLKTATNAAILTGDAATAAATVGIWGGAAAAISGFFAATLAGFEAMVGTMVATVTAVGTFIEGVLSAIADALTTTVFGIPWAGAIVVGIALIAAALAATGNLGFKAGGIGDFGRGTPAILHGPEAIIPLDGRGADFMRNLFSNSGQIIHTHVYLNGREIAMAVSDGQIGAFHSMGVL